MLPYDNIIHAEKYLKCLEENLGPNDIRGSINGFDFSVFIQCLLISENAYVIDTGNWENVNYVCAYRLLNKIKKHPRLWKLFFMIA